MARTSDSTAHLSASGLTNTNRLLSDYEECIAVLTTILDYDLGCRQDLFAVSAASRNPNTTARHVGLQGTRLEALIASLVTDRLLTAAHYHVSRHTKANVATTRLG